VQRTRLRTGFPLPIGGTRGGQNPLAIQRYKGIQRLAAFALFQQRHSVSFGSEATVLHCRYSIHGGHF
jgi:hypothetical protein